jgi:hypothetical protein
LSLRGLYKLLLLLLAVSITGIYLLISSPIRVSKQIKIKGSGKKLYTFMSSENNWEQWLKKNADHPDFDYHFSKNLYPIIFLEARRSNQIIPIGIEIRATANIDSAVLGWRCEIPAGIMPWSRVQRYLEARQLKKDFTEVIKQFTDYAGNTKNLYGISIAESVVEDTIIATLSRFETMPPSTLQGCKMTDELRQQISNAGLSITDSAMTLVLRVEKYKYKIMVGYPVNKIPAANSSLVIKKMIPGKLLTGTVYGGPAAINRGHEQMRKYIIDQNREEVALPFEVSITNKCAVPDTNKWITEICYPVY